MKLKILSDIHLELYPKNNKIVFDDTDIDNILILAGDIGNPSKKIFYNFIEKCSKSFYLVIFVKGNHEIYGNSIENTEKNIIDIVKKFKNVVYLEKSFHDIPNTNYRILGTTLWSDLNYKHKYEISESLNDFYQIKNFDFYTYKNEYSKSLEFLTKEIENNKSINKTLIIITHHAPLIEGTSNPIYKESNINSCFSSDLSELITKNTKSIKYWIFGHTHWSSRIKLCDTEIISNCKGYNSEKTNFDLNLELDLMTNF